MQGKISLRGKLMTHKFKTNSKASFMWKLKNSLTPTFLHGQLAWYVGRPVASALGLISAIGELRAIHVRADGTTVDYGLLGRRSVTTAFCAFAVDQLQTETSEWGDFKYHDSGVGTTAENVTDTAMETTDGESRATGTQTESSSVAYRSVGTIAYTTTKAITEHGLFSSAASTTLMDRTVFSAVNVVSGDSIQFTYTITWTAGG
jgi:hypothetical protein